MAGGAGRRLGGKDKTKLAYREQESFLEHILKELQDFSPIYLSGHPGPSPQRTWLIADKLSGMGPMVGLWSVFSACGEDALLSVPCDMPIFPGIWRVGLHPLLKLLRRIAWFAGTTLAGYILCVESIGAPVSPIWRRVFVRVNFL